MLDDIRQLARFTRELTVADEGTEVARRACDLLMKAAMGEQRPVEVLDLIDELYASLADQSSARLLKRLANYDLIVIDELGYLNLKPEQVNAFFKLMEMRYNRKPTILTTNLEYEDWYELFEKKTLVDALLDRLRHHCTTIHIKGPSLRRPSEDKQESKPPDG